MPQTPFNPWLPVWAHNCCGQIFWDRVWDSADSLHIPHCCRMPYCVSSPLQSQPILAAGWPLVATSNDNCLSPDLFPYKSLTEVKRVTSVRSICFCWPLGAVANHHSHTQSWRKTLPLLNRATPGCHATATHRQCFNAGNTTRRQERVELHGAGKELHKFMPYVLNQSPSASVPEEECNRAGKLRAAGCANQAVTHPEEARS